MALTAEGIIEVPGMASRWVRLGSGAKAHYMTSGDHGPTVLLLHGGLPGSSGTAGWRFMAPFLGANGFRVYAPDMPDPDLMVRTSGEYRVSNYLLWESAYSEFVFTDVLWPDFRREHLVDAVREYQSRDRRFGGVDGT